MSILINKFKEDLSEQKIEENINLMKKYYWFYSMHVSTCDITDFVT